MKIAVANDHAAVEAREAVIEEIRRLGHEPVDFGVRNAESVDYPDRAIEALGAFKRGEADRVVLLCGTGIGMSMVANKVSGVRCAVCTDEYGAEMSRAHNDANCLALRGREIGDDANRRIVRKWIETPFEGGRHQRRVDKIESLARELNGADE